MSIQNINITHNRGLSLIELMVALVIVSVLLLGVTTVYRASKRSYQLNDEVAEVQENARFALQNMTKEIRMAGYTGCDSIKDMTPTHLNVISAVTPPGFDDTFGKDNFIRGHNDNITTWAGTGIAKPADMAPNTDSITIRKVSACSDSLTRKADQAANIETTGNCSAKTGDVFIITDCKQADMFTVSRITSDGHLVHAAPANTPPPILGSSYDTNAHILRPEIVNYYIRTLDGTQSLMQRRFVNTVGGISLAKAELVSNINNMTITYGIDTTGNGSVDVFRPANQVAALDGALQLGKYGDDGDTAWARVMSVNLSFDVNPDPDVQKAQGLGRTFTTAINLRNNTP